MIHQRPFLCHSIDVDYRLGATAKFKQLLHLYNDDKGHPDLLHSERHAEPANAVFGDQNGTSGH